MNTTSARKTGRKSRPWTESDDAALLELRRDGLQAGEIAGRIGRTRRAVEDRMILLRKSGVAGTERLARQVFTEEHDRIMGEMFAAGASYAGIAAATGLFPDQVKGRLKVLRDRGNIAQDRNLATADILGEIRSRKATDARAHQDRHAETARRDAAEELRDWLRTEPRRCRKLAVKHGWAPRPAKRRQLQIA